MRLAELSESVCVVKISENQKHKLLIKEHNYHDLKVVDK